VDFLRGVHVEVSASDIRRRVRGGGSARGLVSAPVEDYIRKTKLYR
jgi:nicotinic acid mononucleotide adenylyltransferase